MILVLIINFLAIIGSLTLAIIALAIIGVLTLSIISLALLPYFSDESNEDFEDT